MAIYDALFEFLDDATIVSATGTTIGATCKTINMGASDLEMGAGEPIWLNIRIGTTVYSGTGNVRISLVADTGAQGQDSSSTIVMTTGLKNVAAAPFITAGAWVLRMPLPVDVDPEQYLGILFEGIAACGSVGKLDAWLDHGPQSSYDTQVTTSNI